MFIDIEITGTTPLLMHRFTDADQDAATSGERAMTADRGTPEEQAAASLYLSPTGEIVLPATNLLRAFIEAGKFFKTGKRQWTTNKSSLVPAALSLNEPWFPLLHKQAWSVDSRPVRIPSTGGRIIRHRPMFQDWQVQCGLIVDVALMSERACRELVDAALTRIGLCDFRPECKGFFGKSKVTLWKPEKADDTPRKKVAAAKSC